MSLWKFYHENFDPIAKYLGYTVPHLWLIAHNYHIMLSWQQYKHYHSNSRTLVMIFNNQVYSKKDKNCG